MKWKVLALLCTSTTLWLVGANEPTRIPGNQTFNKLVADTATTNELMVHDNAVVERDLTVEHDMTVEGDTDLNGDLNVAGAITIVGGIDLVGTVTVTGNLEVSGYQTVGTDITVGGDATVTGTIFGHVTLDPAGTLGAPSINFVGDLDTGVYHPAANQIGLATGGVGTLVIASDAITSNTVIRVSDGTAALPAYAFTSDTNTGMYSAGANQIGLATDGVNRVAVSSAAVLIQSAQVEVPFGTTTAPAYTFSGDTRSGMYFDYTSTGIKFTVDGTTTFQVTGNGVDVKKEFALSGIKAGTGAQTLGQSSVFLMSDDATITLPTDPSERPNGMMVSIINTADTDKVLTLVTTDTLRFNMAQEAMTLSGQTMILTTSHPSLSMIYNDGNVGTVGWYRMY